MPASTIQYGVNSGVSYTGQYGQTGSSGIYQSATYQQGSGFQPTSSVYVQGGEIQQSTISGLNSSSTNYIQGGLISQSGVSGYNSSSQNYLQGGQIQQSGIQGLQSSSSLYQSTFKSGTGYTPYQAGNITQQGNISGSTYYKKQ
jgi:hypothetical protein